MARTTAVRRSGWRTGPIPGKRAAIRATTGSAAASPASAAGAVGNAPASTRPAAAASAPASASTSSTGSATVPAGRAAVPTMASPMATARSHTRPSQRSSRSSPERRYTSRLPARSTGPGTGTARATVLVDAERGGGRGRAGDPEVLEQDQLAPEQGRLGGQPLGRRRDRQQPLLVGQVDLEPGRDQIGGGHRVVGQVDRLGLPAGHLQQGGHVAGEQPARLEGALLGRLPGGLGQLA